MIKSGSRRNHSLAPEPKPRRSARIHPYHDDGRHRGDLRPALYPCHSAPPPHLPHPPHQPPYQALYEPSHVTSHKYALSAPQPYPNQHAPLPNTESRPGWFPGPLALDRDTASGDTTNIKPHLPHERHSQPHAHPHWIPSTLGDPYPTPATASPLSSIGTLLRDASHVGE